MQQSFSAKKYLSLPQWEFSVVMAPVVPHVFYKNAVQKLSAVCICGCPIVLAIAKC